MKLYEKELGEFVENISDTEKINKDEVILVNTSDVENGKVINHNYVKNSNLKGQFKKRFKRNDILYSEIRPKNKRFAYIDFDSEDYIASTKLMVLRNKGNIDNEYLYQILKSDYVINYLQHIAEARSGTFPQITFNELARTKIMIPDQENQKKIAYILNSIDKKIKLNTHTNNNLYEIGKAIYQEYFENEKYTSSYEIKQLSEVTTNNRNKIDKTKEYKVLSAVNTGKLILSDDYFDKQVYSKDIGKYLIVNKNDFAYNPARINIGSIGLNDYDFNCCVSPVYVTFSVDKDYIDFFDFYFKSKRFNAEVTLRATGSVRQALNYNDFGMIEIPYPTKEMIEKFNSSYKTIKERININKTKISNLEQLRDTLLPKLMNGKIDLDKIEI